MNNEIIAKALKSKSFDSYRLRMLLADMISCGDVEIIRHSDNLKRQGLMNKLMQDIDNAEINH